MDLIDKLKTLSLKISKQLSLLQTEEATKNALVLCTVNKPYNSGQQWLSDIVPTKRFGMSLVKALNEG
jgi:hypothetical protein